MNRKILVWGTLFALLLVIPSIPLARASPQTYVFNADGASDTTYLGVLTHKFTTTQQTAGDTNTQFFHTTTVTIGSVVGVEHADTSFTPYAGTLGNPVSTFTVSGGSEVDYQSTISMPQIHFSAGDVLLDFIYAKCSDCPWGTDWNPISGGFRAVSLPSETYLLASTWTLHYFINNNAGGNFFRMYFHQSTFTTSKIDNIDLRASLPAVTCDFTWSPTPVYKGNATTFTATTNATTPHYSWNWSDGSSNSTGNPIIHTFNVIGVANVTLIVNDTSTGVTCTVLHQVTILNPPPPVTPPTPPLCFNIAPWLFFISAFLVIALMASAGWCFTHVNIRGGIFSILFLIPSLSILYVSVFIQGCP